MSFTLNKLGAPSQLTRQNVKVFNIFSKAYAFQYFMIDQYELERSDQRLLARSYG